MIKRAYSAYLVVIIMVISSKISVCMDEKCHLPQRRKQNAIIPQNDSVTQDLEDLEKGCDNFGSLAKDDIEDVDSLAKSFVTYCYEGKHSAKKMIKKYSKEFKRNKILLQNAQKMVEKMKLLENLEQKLQKEKKSKMRIPDISYFPMSDNTPQNLQNAFYMIENLKEVNACLQKMQSNSVDKNMAKNRSLFWNRLYAFSITATQFLTAVASIAYVVYSVIEKN